VLAPPAAAASFVSSLQPINNVKFIDVMPPASLLLNGALNV